MQNDLGQGQFQTVANNTKFSFWIFIFLEKYFKKKSKIQIFRFPKKKVSDRPMAFQNAFSQMKSISSAFGLEKNLE